jgi:hypothetical protein
MISTLRRELFDRLLIIDEHRLRQMLTEYVRRYNTARPHRALSQLAPTQARTWPPGINLAEHRIRRKQVLGGLTHEYRIAASPPDSCRLSPQEAGHRHGRVFVPTGRGSPCRRSRRAPR